MVRTRADSSARKAVASKAPRKQLASSCATSSSPGASFGKCTGGNPVKWWPAPSWQKGIGQFFSHVESDNPSSEPSNSVPPKEQCSSSQQATSLDEKEV